MNTLIVYDSLYGNTEKIALAIKEGLEEGNLVKAIKAKDARINDLENIELFIVGSPTHGGRASEQTHKFLDTIQNNSLKNIKALAFDTGVSVEGQKFIGRLAIKTFGYAAKRIAETLKQKGANLIEAETFFVLGYEGPIKEGELKRAKEWGKQQIVIPPSPSAKVL